MDVADALVFALLTLGDLTLIAHLRRARRRRIQKQRMMRSLELAVQRENAQPVVPPRRWPALRRAS